MVKPANADPATQLVMFTRGIEKLREALAELEASRDAVIRRADSEELLGRPEMVKLTGLTRPRVWQIINPGYRHGVIEQTGEEVVGEDEAALETADVLYQAAYWEWEQNDRQGTPDEYFAIDAVVMRDRL